MPVVRFKILRIFFLLAIVLYSGRASGQLELTENQAAPDTSAYIPVSFEGSLNYNLMIAASKGYPSEIERLIGKGADINTETFEGATPLVFAVSNNKLNAVRTILSLDPVIDKITSSNETPLLIAVKNDFFFIAEELIRSGADLNFTDKNRATSLHYATLYGYFEMTDLLLYYDAMIDQKSTDGSTPLLGAVWAGNIEIVDLLIQRGANIEEKDNEGLTPFLLASYAGDTILMDLLFKKGANIYGTSNNGHNALTLCILAGNTDAAKYLLRIGNEWSAQKNKASDLYNVAAKYGRKDLIQILQSNNVPGRLKYEIDQVEVTLNSRFFLHDFYSGISLAFREPFLNVGIIAGCDTKLWYTKVLMKKSENLFYQYMDKGSLVYTGLFKDFILTENLNKFNFLFSTSLLAGYSFGNKLKGTSFVPDNKFKLLPAIAFKWTGLHISFNLGMEYIKSEFYHTGPIWLRAGISYNYYFDDIRTKIKPIRWYSR